MTASPPTFETNLFPATYWDIVIVRDVAKRVVDSSDIDLLPSSESRDAFREGLDLLEGIVFRGPLLFPLALLNFDELSLAVAGIVNSFIEMECNGFQLDADTGSAS